MKKFAKILENTGGVLFVGGVLVALLGLFAPMLSEFKNPGKVGKLVPFGWFLNLVIIPGIIAYIGYLLQLIGEWMIDPFARYRRKLWRAIWNGDVRKVNQLIEKK